MSETKTLSGKLAEIYNRYREERAAVMNVAQEALTNDLLKLKALLGVSSLKATFYDDADGSCASLEVQEKLGGDWDDWDAGFDHLDGYALLEEAHKNLDEISSYLEWNGLEITV